MPSGIAAARGGKSGKEPQPLKGLNHKINLLFFLIQAFVFYGISIASHSVYRQTIGHP